MVAVNANGLPKDSFFRSANRVLLLKNPIIETQVKKEGEDSSDEKEGSRSTESKEMSRQIDFHVVVLDDDHSRNSTPTFDKNIAQSIVSTER